MRKLIITAILVLVPTVVFAQQNMNAFGIGFGFTAPIAGGGVPISAEVNDTGIVNVTKILDETPRIFIEIHRIFPLGDIGIGPVIGIAPRFDTGLSSNEGQERAPGIGFGGLVSLPVGETRHFNMGVMYMVDVPTDRLDPRFQNGFQAPRDGSDNPLSPVSIERSNKTLVVIFTISGLF